MDEMMKDDRFAHVARDPKFRRIPKSERKVKIDKRFQSMFKDKNFTVKYTVDKRGRPVNQSTQENLRKYYDLQNDDSSENDETEETLESEKKQKKKQKGKKESLKKKNEKVEIESKSENEDENVSKSEDENENESLEEEEESDDESSQNSILRIRPSPDKKEKESKKVKKDLKIELRTDEKSLPKDVKKKIRSSHVDYARGEGVLFSDSSSSEEEDSEECDEIDESIVHDWGEFDKDAETTDTITNRLAVCNMDWDRIRAVDLMVLFSSFLPKGSLITSVTIYPSEFGLERMKEEEIKGPTELVQSKPESQNDCEDEEEGASYHREKMRQYQLNRLKYYYAVVVCDSPETADKIYTECDGTEFELTGARIDLRFIPDDTTFDQKPREVCDKLPDVTKYKPRHFTTTALQQVKVDLTWDETDPSRVEIFEKLNAGKFDEVDDSELRNYLASGSSSEEEPEPETKPDGTKPKKMSTIEKYKALLKSIDEEEEEKKKNKNMEFEVSWDLDAKEKAEKLAKESANKSNEMTPFEKFVEKKKEKKKAKKDEKKKLKQQQRDERDDSDVPSDVDMNDPYFAEEIQAMKKSSKKRKVSENEEEDSEEERNKAELELLLMDKQEDTKKHFNMKKIEEVESMSKSKKKRLEKKKKKVEVADEFEVDTEDPRFAAIYTSHHFNIDPSDPHYRKTKGTDALIQKKLTIRNNDAEDQPAKTINKKDLKNAELSALVKSVKRKASGLKK